MKFTDLFTSNFYLIGVLHLPPMPGFKDSPGLEKVIEFAIEETSTLINAGFDAVLVENEGDRPHPLSVSDEYLENFKQVIKAIKSTTKMPVGLEILYDMIATVKVAINSEADFVRLDVYTDDTETKWGIVKACVNEIENLKIKHPDHFPLLLTDIHVKHGKNLSGRTLIESTKLAKNHNANGLIVTGTLTGIPPTLEDCQTMHEASEGLPVLVGSGFALENAEDIAKYCNGAVVASSIKSNERLDLEKASKLSKLIRSMK